uniref:Secreted protein n=1 Tax=Anguilla anguilla TaxID=7936 RepID=A0A0E9WH22_ANGAN
MNPLLVFIFCFLRGGNTDSFEWEQIFLIYRTYSTLTTQKQQKIINQTTEKLRERTCLRIQTLHYDHVKSASLQR